MPRQLPEIAGALKAAGIELDPQLLGRLDRVPLGAVVSVDGCSAAFVSAQGLVLTNHHCAHGSIQYNSTPARNLLRDGFLARTRGEELRTAPGTRVYVNVDAQDVTARMLDSGTARLTGRRRIAALEANEKRLVAECESEAGYRCSVAKLFGGTEFQLIKRFEIRDVRLVYAPPEGVGKFGGDADNWMWPRHTGDFTFLRAYVGRDGRPADYAADNVPYRPAHHLALAAQGVREGDFVMVAGYPRVTNRYRLPSEIEFAFEWQYPQVVRAAREQLDVLERATRGRDAASLAYAGLVAGIHNILKSTEGRLNAYANAPFLEERQHELAMLREWIQSSPARAREYSKAIAALEGSIAQRQSAERQHFLMPYARPRLLSIASNLYELARQRARPDADRKPGFQERDMPMIRESLAALDKRYDEQVDKALARHFLTRYLAQPPGERNDEFLAALGLKAGMSETEIDERVDELYAGSQLADRMSRAAWLDRDAAAFQASNDTFIKAAVTLYPQEQKRGQAARELDGNIDRAYGAYMKALVAYRHSRGETLYPDANATLRISFGRVAGRVPGAADGTAWTAFTTLEGLAAKHTGQGEFNAPEKELAAIAARRFGPYVDPSLSSVPVDFLATLDITGGSSGSAVLNARGELVGVVFDQTLDSAISAWRFDGRAARAIATDLRYILWYLQAVEAAGELLRELGVGQVVAH